MRPAVLVAAAALLMSCSKPKETTANNRDTMTRRQKDSVLAQSGLPGSQGVGMALKTADSLKARQAAMDSASKP
jgi:hypothetical protein